ncbi:hypothetical protein D9M70_616820 [compost metagenome]
MRHRQLVAWVVLDHHHWEFQVVALIEDRGHNFGLSALGMIVDLLDSDAFDALQLA